MSDVKTSTEQEAEVPLMDREWERQQIKSFTAWMNLHGKNKGLVIDDIREDLRDGKKLLRFLEIISGDFPPKAERGNLRVHMINNVRHALDFIAKKGVKLVGTGAEEIVDGNLKMTLGMIWVMILRFTIAVIDDQMSSASDGLLLWVKKKTEGYKGVNVKNFTTSFKDGLALNALIHRHRPDLLNYDELSPSGARHNLNQALAIADQHLGIPPMLEVEDMLISPDRKSVMTYVASLYHVFSQDQAVENAMRRINRILDSKADNDSKVAEYEKVATDLLEWIKEKNSKFSEDVPEDYSIDQLLSEIGDMTTFRKDEKPPKAKEKGKLESLINTLKTRMHLLKRPEFVPVEGHGIKDIQEAWKEMEKLEKTRLDRLYLILKRLYYIDHLFKKYIYKCDQQDIWISGKVDQFSGDVSVMLIGEVMVQKKKVVALTHDMESREARLKVIKNLRQKLQELNCSSIDVVEQRFKVIEDAWNDTKEKREDYLKRLNEREIQLQELDNLKQSYAQKAIELKNYLDEAFEDLNDTYQVQNVDETKEIQNELTQFVEGFEKQESNLQEVLALENQIQQSGDPANLYSNIAVQDLSNKYQQVKNAVVAREEALNSEYSKQMSNDTLRQDFAKLSEEIDAFKVETLLKVQQAPDKTEKLEDQLALLKTIAEDVDQFYKDKFPSLQTIHSQLQDAQVFHNPFTTHTMESISAEYQHLMDSLSTFVNEVENQIILRDSTGITEQQVKDYKKSFEYFDKDHINYLNSEEFRSFLISLEYNVDPETPQGESEFQSILAQVDPDKTSQITFNSFLNFAATASKQSDSAENMIESFKVLAGGKDYITPDILRKEFPDKADSIISAMSESTVLGAPEGALDYRTYSASVFGETEL